VVVLCRERIHFNFFHGTGGRSITLLHQWRRVQHYPNHAACMQTVTQTTTTLAVQVTRINKKHTRTAPELQVVMLDMLEGLLAWTAHSEHQEVWAGPSWSSYALQVRSLFYMGSV
jgi:hypothetical protein